MKNCPSCNAACDERTNVCDVCGHAFDAGAPKRTMMGFPSLAAALEEAEKDAPDEPSKHTLFGFPAQKGAGGSASEISESKPDSEAEPEPESEPIIELEDEHDAGAATSILSASAFAMEMDRSSGDELVPATIESDLRGTLAGLPLNPSRDAATEVVSGTAVFPGNRPAEDYVQPAEEEDDRRHQGTLMGMSLADINANAPPPSGGGRSTQFAMPAIQAEAIQEHTSNLETSPPATSLLDGSTSNYKPETAEPSANSLAEESEDQIDDSPTQAWAPGSLLSGDKPNQDKRKKLLDKIRSSRAGGTKTAARERPSGEGPDLSALKKLRPKGGLLGSPPPDERDTNEQPAVKRPSLPSAAVLRMANDADAPTQETNWPPEGGLDFVLSPTDEDSLGESISDPDFGFMETDIVSADMLKAVANGMESTPGVSIAQNGDAPASTRPRSLSSANAHSPKPARTAGRGIYETFNGGTAPPKASQPAPQVPAQPKHQPKPAPPAAFVPQTPRPAQPQRKQPPKKTQPQPYQPGPADAQNHGTNQAPAPYLPGQPTTSPAAAPDPLVGKIQAGFGIGAGVIAIVVQLGVLTSHGLPKNTFGVGVIALSVTLAIAAVGIALFPLDSKLRSTGYYGIAVALALCFVLGIVSGLPKMFLIIGLGALLALVAGAFPHFTRFLQ